MTQILRICAASWSTGVGPAPGRAAVETMLEQLSTEIEEFARAIQRDVQPIAVVAAESWKGEGFENQRRFLSELSIEIGPGRGERPLRSWFQHQHAGFKWSQRAFPDYIVPENGQTPGPNLTVVAGGAAQ